MVGSVSAGQVVGLSTCQLPPAKLLISEHEMLPSAKANSRSCLPSYYFQFTFIMDLEQLF